MKNLWHIIILFMLPGLVLGGNTIAAIFRFTDGKLEPLAALSLAGIIWTATAYIFSAIINHLKAPSKIYYPAMALTAILFTIVVGGTAVFCGNGTAVAAMGITASAVAFAGAAHSFVSSQYTLWCRWSFIIGTLAGTLPWLYGVFYSRLAWMETLFHYLAVLLLLTWALASPLTRRGSQHRQWSWRILLLLCIAGSFYTIPVFSPPPTIKIAGKLWTKTHTTVNGRKFILMEKSGRYAFYTPDGSLIMNDKCDENSSGAILALLSLHAKEKPQIQVVAPATSALPRILRELVPAKIRHHRLPESMFIRRFYQKKPDFRAVLPQYPRQVQTDHSTDILLMTALPENQYPLYLKNFLTYFTSNMNWFGVVALPQYLLKNPVVFSFMHENFPYLSILPTPGDWWVFSKVPLDISLKSISKNLHEVFRNTPGLSADMFEIIYSNRNLWEQIPSPEQKTAPRYGNNQLLGSWWWLLTGIGIAVLWRIIRLFGERRNMMYACFNAVENGFSGMGTFLLILSLLLINNGSSVLFLAMLSTIFILFLSNWKAGGVWLSLAGLSAILWIFNSSGNNTLLAVIILCQTILLTGAMPSINTPDKTIGRQKLCWVFLGMLLGACAVTVCWLYNVPFLLMWAMIFAARVPGIWQYSKKSVYYKDR